MSKREFLDDLRLTRNLFVHGAVTAAVRRLDPAALAQALTRAAIWLTPSAVTEFRADDFRELGPDDQPALAEAVQEFDRVAKEIPPDGAATGRQFVEASAALEKILEILGHYLPSHEEPARVRAALAGLDYPNWVLNRDYEFGSDEDGAPTVRVTLYADEGAIPPDQLGRHALEMVPKLRAALTAARISRWPFVRMRARRAYKAG